MSKSSRTKDLDCESPVCIEVCWIESTDRVRGLAVCNSTFKYPASNGNRANDFAVPPEFLLQQAAWLYERHLDHVRAQMKKVGGQNLSVASGIDHSHAKESAPAMDRRVSNGPLGGNLNFFSHTT